MNGNRGGKGMGGLLDFGFRVSDEHFLALFLFVLGQRVWFQSSSV